MRSQSASIPCSVLQRRKLFVRQRLPIADVDGRPYDAPAEAWRADDRSSGTPGALSASTRWATPGEDRFDQTQVLAFAMVVADKIVSDRTEYAKPATELCNGPGVVTLWLAAGSNDAGRSAFEIMRRRGNDVSTDIVESSWAMMPGYRETEVVAGLLRIERASVAQTVKANWETLTDGETSVDEAAEILGVPRPAPLPEGYRQCGDAS